MLLSSGGFGENGSVLVAEDFIQRIELVWFLSRIKKTSKGLCTRHN